MHLSGRNVQPNTKVLLARKGGETEKNNEDRKMHHPGGDCHSCSGHFGLPRKHPTPTAAGEDDYRLLQVGLRPQGVFDARLSVLRRVFLS